MGTPAWKSGVKSKYTVVLSSTSTMLASPNPPGRQKTGRSLRESDRRGSFQQRHQLDHPPVHKPPSALRTSVQNFSSLLLNKCIQLRITRHLRISLTWKIKTKEKQLGGYKLLREKKYFLQINK